MLSQTTISPAIRASFVNISYELSYLRHNKIHHFLFDKIIHKTHPFSRKKSATRQTKFLRRSQTRFPSLKMHQIVFLSFLLFEIQKFKFHMKILHDLQLVAVHDLRADSLIIRLTFFWTQNQQKLLYYQQKLRNLFTSMTH